MTDSTTVMNNLSSRIIPGSIEETIEYYDTVSLFDRPSISFKALLLANMEKLGSEISIIKWGVERSARTRSYINHLLRIGRVIIDTEDKVFKILQDFSYDKYLELLTLSKNDIPKFVISRGKELTGMTRDELRTEVYKVLGKEPAKSKSDKEQMLLPGFDDAVNCITHLVDDEFDFAHVVKDAAVQEKAIKSGLHLLGAAISYECDKKIPNTEVLMDLKQNFLDTAKGIEQIIAKASPDNILEA